MKCYVLVAQGAGGPIHWSVPRILDVGCGINKYPGAIGLDHNPRSHADILAELDHFPWPLKDSSFDQVRLIHVIEHVGDVVKTVEECYRILRPGGVLVLETPHYTDFSSFCDPTHRWHLNSFSFRYFGADDAGYGYYSDAKFAGEEVEVKLLTLWRYLGFEYLVNSARVFRKFWEHYLCYVIRGKVMTFRLRKAG